MNDIVDHRGRAGGREPRECPFAGVAVPVPLKDSPRMGLAMQRAECTESCALFDTKTGRTCLDRVEDLVRSFVARGQA